MVSLVPPHHPNTCASILRTWPGFLLQKKKNEMTTEETRGSKSCVSPRGKTKGDACGCGANILHALCTHFLSAQTAFTETKYRSFSPLLPARLDPPLLLLRYQYGIINRKKKTTRTHTVALPNQQQGKHRTPPPPPQEKRKVTKLGRLIRENTAHIRR